MTPDTHTVETKGGVNIDHPATNRRFNVDPPDFTHAPLDMVQETFSSSNVYSAIYDFGERELYIRFIRKEGGDAIYMYERVPAEVWQGLVNADSKGGFVNRNIAYQYPYALLGRDIHFESEFDISRDLVRRFVYG